MRNNEWIRLNKLHINNQRGGARDYYHTIHTCRKVNLWKQHFRHGKPTKQSVLPVCGVVHDSILAPVDHIDWQS